MIATIKGTVSEKLTNLIVIETNGLGYGLFVTNDDYNILAVGEQAKVYIYEHIRENTHDLYAFTNLATQALFEQLLDVNGVGPRMALNMLSVGSTDELRTAIITGDTKFIQAASGVGKRVAERIVVDLKDKLGAEGVDLSKTSLLQSETSLLKDEAIEALVSLGFNPQDAAKALREVDETLPSGERVRLALKESTR